MYTQQMDCEKKIGIGEETSQRKQNKMSTLKTRCDTSACSISFKHSDSNQAHGNGSTIYHTGKARLLLF